MVSHVPDLRQSDATLVQAVFQNNEAARGCSEPLACNQLLRTVFIESDRCVQGSSAVICQHAGVGRMCLPSAMCRLRSIKRHILDGKAQDDTDINVQMAFGPVRIFGKDMYL